MPMRSKTLSTQGKRQCISMLTNYDAIMCMDADELAAFLCRFAQICAGRMSRGETVDKDYCIGFLEDGVE